MTVDFDDSLVDAQRICSAVDHAGYGSTPREPVPGTQGRTASTRTASPTKKLEETARAMRTRLVVSLVFLIPLFYIGMGHMLGWPLPAPLADHDHAMTLALVELLLLIPIVFANRAYFKNGFLSLLHRAPTMDALIAIGSGASIAWSVYALLLMAEQLAGGDVHGAAQTAMDNLYFESAGTILTLVTVANTLKPGRSQKREA